MTAYNNGHQVICSHIVTARFLFRGREYAAQDEIMGVVLLAGPCKGFHFQLHPN